jgi:hypothetical protein
MSDTKVSLWPIAPAYLSVSPFTNVMSDRKVSSIASTYLSLAPFANVMSDRKVLLGVDTLANLFGASVTNKKSLKTLTQE